MVYQWHSPRLWSHHCHCTNTSGAGTCSWGQISNICILLNLRNYRKYKFILMIPKINWIIDTPVVHKASEMLGPWSYCLGKITGTSSSVMARLATTDVSSSIMTACENRARMSANEITGIWGITLLLNSLAPAGNKIQLRWIWRYPGRY